MCEQHFILFYLEYILSVSETQVRVFPTLNRVARHLIKEQTKTPIHVLSLLKTSGLHLSYSSHRTLTPSAECFRHQHKCELRSHRSEFNGFEDSTQFARNTSIIRSVSTLSTRMSRPVQSVSDTQPM